MSVRKTLRRWHLWLGWMVGVPILLWTLSGLAMVVRPIEEVRGEHLRIVSDATLPAGNPAAIAVPAGGPPERERRTRMQGSRAVTTITYADGRIARFDAGTGTALGPVDSAEARAILAHSIRGGDAVRSLVLFDADAPPDDFRRPLAVWQATLAEDTHVYIGRDSGEIEAVRTRWWRIYDWFWGLHIMDLETREDSHNAWLVLFGALSLVATLMALVLLPLSTRRRR